MAWRSILAMFTVAVVAVFGSAPALAEVGAGRSQGLAGIEFGRYHALVIGNNKYQHLSDLKTAVNDANDLALILERDYEYSVTRLLNATRADILESLVKLRETLTPADNLLIYYAGHGYLDEIVDQGYWLPVDAEESVPTNWVSMTTVTGMLKAIRAKHVMVVADSCYSGTLVRAAQVGLKTSKDKRAWIERMLTKRARVALVSGGLEPVVDSGGDGRHSAFATAFLGVLGDNDGVMDGQAVFDAIKRPLALRADQTPRYSDIRKADHGGGEFLFVKRRVIKPAPSPPGPVAAVVAQSPVSSVDKEAMFWETIQKSNNPDFYDAYLKQYPNGTFAFLAKAKIAELTTTSSQTASAPPSKPAVTVSPMAAVKVSPRDEAKVLARTANVRARPSSQGARLKPARVRIATGFYPKTAGGFAPGRIFKDCPECPEMVVVAADSFVMGSPESDTGDGGGEGPRHRVTIPRSFAVGEYEVTFAEWDACVAAGGCNGYRPDDRGWGRGRQPVINVNLDDARAYVSWLRRTTGKSYRLLSESEWEYVARGGTTTRYYWGNDVGRNNANCDGCGSRWDDDQTAAVGSFEANGFGLHDVHGNVWERVEDCWNESYSGAPADGSAWKTGDCSLAVARGGSWNYDPMGNHDAYSVWVGTEQRDDYLGFRVARTD